MAVSQTASVYNVSLPTGSKLSFGYVEQNNYNPIGYNIGDRILYPMAESNPVIILNQVQYNLIDENKIILREPIDPPV
jgi:hypothetical protein